MLSLTAMASIEKGFQPVDGAGIACNGQKLVLIRMPKDFNTDALEGLDVTLTSGFGGPKQLLHEQKTFEITVERPISAEILRPIVSSRIDGSAKIGPIFTTSITINQKIPLNLISTLKGEPVKIVNAYEHVKQVKDLRVGSLPKGSYTTIEELLQGKKALYRNSRIRDSVKASDETPQSGKHGRHSTDNGKEEKKKKKHRRE